MLSNSRYQKKRKALGTLLFCWPNTRYRIPVTESVPYWGRAAGQSTMRTPTEAV